jgi:hypothetical protein
MTQDLPPRAADIFRHLADLRSGTYEGARQWPERVEVFRRAVSLLDPVVRRVLEANAVFLHGTGTIHHRAGDDRDGGGLRPLGAVLARAAAPRRPARRTR